MVALVTSMCNLHHFVLESIPGGAVVNNPPANAGDTRNSGLIPELRRSPGVGNGNPFQCSCLENSMDKEPGGLQSVRLQRDTHD